MPNIILSVLLVVFGVVLIYLGRKFNVKRFVEKDSLHAHYNRAHVGKYIRLYNWLIYVGIKYSLIVIGVTLIFVGIYIIFVKF